MNKETHPVKSQKPFLVFLFYFLLFVYPLLSFFWRRSYPLFTAETGTLFLVGIVVCGFLSVILTNVRSAVASVLSALFITVSLMVQFNLLLEGVILCFSTSLVLAWLLKNQLYIYRLPILLALILGALFDSYADDSRTRSADDQAKTNTNLPPVIHILLDAFAGPDGLPPYPASAAMKEDIYKFFGDYDFQVFPRAYSRYSQTGDSLYSAMNFRNDGNSGFSLEVSNRQAHVLKSNALFDSLADLGYRINIYQTGHLDFCQSHPGNTDNCWSYTHPYVSSIQEIPDFKLRLNNLAGVLLKQSTILTDLFQSRGWFYDMGVTVHDPAVFANLKRDILNGSDGRYFFAHVLLPHGPFAYLRDCSIDYETKRYTRFPLAIGEPPRPDSVYETRFELYFEQMRCSMLSLSNIFNNMKKSDLFERSIIVVHGDHGSLIGRRGVDYRDLPNLTPEDYRSNFSTLFAIKFPFGSFQSNDQILPLDLLMEGFANAITVSSNDQKTPLSELDISTDDQTRLDKYVFLTGAFPLYRLNINIFDNMTAKE